MIEVTGADAWIMTLQYLSFGILIGLFLAYIVWLNWLRKINKLQLLNKENDNK